MCIRYKYVYCSSALLYHLREFGLRSTSVGHPHGSFPCRSVGSSQAITLVDRIRSKGRKEALRPVVGPPVAINPESQLGRCWPVKGERAGLPCRWFCVVRRHVFCVSEVLNSAFDCFLIAILCVDHQSKRLYTIRGRLLYTKI